MSTDDLLKSLAENAERQTRLLESLAQQGQQTKQAPANAFKPSYFDSHYEKAWQAREKAVGTVPTFTELHGQGGIFSGPGLEREVITAHIRPKGIAGILPKFPSVDENPRFASLTGYTAVTGTEPTNPCADAPTGYVKGCNLTARFGLIRRDTQTIELDKVMLRANRGDFTDLVLKGRVLGMSGLTPSGLNESQILNIVTMSEMVTAAVNAERKWVVDLWQGTVAAGGTYGPGLDVQIATGQRDADTNTLCPALDSNVLDFGYDLVGGSGRDIVEYVSSQEHYLFHNASRMGLDPANWMITMRPELWEELTVVWPCAYNTTRCTTAMIGGTSAQTFIDGRENINERDEMRRNMTLRVNGRDYQVVLDDGINEKTNITNAQIPAGQYASSIYFVPLTITGNFPVTYIQYLDYRAWKADSDLLTAMGGGLQAFWTDQGMFSWALTSDKWCYKLSLKMEPRVVLRTPQLAGRIDNVRYAPLSHLRSFDPASPYFFDGGVSARTPATTYAVWL